MSDNSTISSLTMRLGRNPIPLERINSNISDITQGTAKWVSNAARTISEQPRAIVNNLGDGFAIVANKDSGICPGGCVTQGGLKKFKKSRKYRKFRKSRKSRKSRKYRKY